MSFATCAFSISDVMAGTKTRCLFRIESKSGENKRYGPKWETHENVGTKICFSPYL